MCPRVPVSPSRSLAAAVPRRSRRRSRGPRHTSTCPRCSGRWHMRTRSRSRAGALGTENTECALSVGTRRLRGQGVSLGGHRLTRTHGRWHWGQGGTGRAGGAARGARLAPPPSPFPPHSRAPGSLRGCWGVLWLSPRSLTVHRAAPAPLLPTPAAPQAGGAAAVPWQSLVPVSPHRVWGQTPPHSSLARPVLNPGGWHVAQSPAWDGSRDPSPPHGPGVLGHRDPPVTARDCGGRGGRGVSRWSRESHGGDGFWSQVQAMHGPCGAAGLDPPHCGSVEGDAGADAQ